MDKTVYLINVARHTNQIQLSIAFSVLINSLKLHGIEPALIDLIPVEAEKRMKHFKSEIPDEPSIFGFNLIAGNRHLDITEQYAKIILSTNPEHIIVYGGPPCYGNP